MSNDSKTRIISVNLNTNYSENTDLNNPRWILPKNINNIKAIKLKNIVIPLSSYNVNQYNNKFFLKENSTTITGQISVGNYSSTNFPSILASALNFYTVQPTTYTVTMNTNNSTLVFGGSNAFSFEQSSTKTDIYSQIGIKTSQLSTQVTSLTAGNSIDLSGIKSLNIVCPTIPAITVVGENYNLLASIPIDSSLNSVLAFNDESNDYIDTEMGSINEISIQLKDLEFRSIDQRTDYALTINFITDA